MHHDAKSDTHRVGILSVVPSPYQRDLFSALADHQKIDLSVFYQSAESIDNPWPEAELFEFEHLLPGRRVSYGKKRAYVNWDLPDFGTYDLAILNTSYFSTSAQWLMRTQLKEATWVFWGERMRKQPSWWRRAVQRQVAAPLRGADAIAGIGTLAKESYRWALPERQLYNIPYFCDLAPYIEAQEIGASGGAVTILFCGQMIERKGVDLLLRAFDRLVQEDVGVQLRLVGREAALPDMMQAVSGPARDRIEMLGFRPPEELPLLFGPADVFVLPSRHDGWGVVVNQALGAGLPVICSDEVGAGHDLVEPNENGVRIPAGEIEPLYDALKRVTMDTALRQEWAEGARATASEWGLEEGVSRWLTVVQDLVSGTPRVGRATGTSVTEA